MATGTGEVSMARIIERIEASRPPGVSSCTTTISVLPSAARRRPRWK
ncbi:hypothetical protein [Halomonas sp. A11-A]